MSYAMSALEQEFESAVTLYQVILENETLFSSAVLLAAIDLRSVVENLINY